MSSSAEVCQNDCEEEAMPHRNYCSTECYREAVRAADVRGEEDA